MAVGRISGPLLAQNLLRNGVDLAFETNLLYLDVTNGRIGIKTNSPQYELDVNGTVNALQLISTSATIGLMTFFSSTSSSTISSIQGPINIIPPALENIYLGADTTVEGNLHATGDITADGNIRLGSSTSTDSLFVEADIKTDVSAYSATGTNISEFSIGTSSSYWLNGYFDTIRTNKIDSGTGTGITVFPNDTTGTWINGIPNQAITINGDIRVYGGSPIGTAPVVSNVLYVTEDGDDNNDGRAEDASRACRTITGATLSPYYKQGTVIKVRSGSYYENNPIKLLPYTSVIGDDLRTTFIYPINNTKDLFWVNSGVYIAQMSFLNLRRGPGVTRYAPGGVSSYETGAYCVAFPPNLTNPIDVYHSPYIQNCTNQSGPWLMDGTMFVPNNTVQLPRVWGTGTYAANTTTIIFTSSSTEMVNIGDTINSAGFLVDPSVSGPVVTNVSNPDINFNRAQTLLKQNRTFVQTEVTAYLNTSFPTLSYNQTTCFRDIGYIMDAITYDATLGGNVQSVNAALSYYNGNTLVIPSNETTATIAAVRYINTLCQLIVTNSEPVHYYQNNVTQYVNTNLYGGGVAIPNIQARTNDIIDILSNWTGYENAAALMVANLPFIQTETIAWIAYTYPSLSYNQDLCYRDVGLIVNAVQEDLLHKSNVKSVEAAGFYWEGVTSIIPMEQTQTAAAVEFVKGLTTYIVQNETPPTSYQNTVTQVVNTSLTGGAVALTSIQTNFDTIATIISSGTNALSIPPSTNSTLTTFLITLSTSTISAANSATTVYFGDTTVYPYRDADVPTLWTSTGIADRRLDPHGSGGGALVDGNAPSTRSPIQSFVFDAFTQLTQGGNGIHIMNNGYAQLVSVFTIFADVAVHCESGGIASITNSNSNFGDQCLLAEGYGSLEFSGTVYNPQDTIYDTNYNTWTTSPYYPAGFFPKNQEICIFVPNSANRPHIGLVMEVVPPDYYINYNGETIPYVNSQGFPGFLAAASNTSTITAGSYTITGIDTTDISVGHTINIRDQYGNEGPDGNGLYISSGTVVTGISYQTVTLSNPILITAGQKFNDNYFTLYFSGNAYYTILSSTVATNPVTPGQSKIPGEQLETTAALNYLTTLMEKVVSNTVITGTHQTSVTQTIDNTRVAGSGTNAFISSEIGIITSIINQGPTATPVIANTGTVAPGASDAIALLQDNIKFLKSEVLAFTTSTYVGFDFNQLKCYRDVGLIVNAVINDLRTGGNFYASQAGNTYYSQNGTYHIVTIEENVVDPTLFVDGCVVNFYQRSYMSASGYLFEYVGAGTDYGALPQVGKADPVQTKETIELNNGKVFFTSTDQNGDFRIGPQLVISQATGVISGRTFQKSLFAEMTPFILAIEADAGGA
jgi:hypothetical protein